MRTLNPPLLCVLALTLPIKTGAQGFPQSKEPIALSYSIKSTSKAEQFRFQGIWNYAHRDSRTFVKFDSKLKLPSDFIFLYDGSDTLSLATSQEYAQLWRGYHGASQSFIVYMPFETANDPIFGQIDSIPKELNPQNYASSSDSIVWRSAFVLNGERHPDGPVFLPCRSILGEAESAAPALVQRMEIGTFEPNLPIPLTFQYKNYIKVGNTWVPKKIIMEGQPGVVQYTPEPINAVITFDLVSASSGGEVNVPDIEDLVPKGWSVNYADFEALESATIEFDPNKGTVKQQIADQLAIARLSKPPDSKPASPTIPWEFISAVGAMIAALIIGAVIIRSRRRKA